MLDYMREHGSITQLEALQKLGVMSLSSRISGLRKRGEAIQKETIKVKNRYGTDCRIARYFLEESK